MAGIRGPRQDDAARTRRTAERHDDARTARRTARQQRAERRRRAFAASAAAERARAAATLRRATQAARHPADHPPPGPFRPGTWRSPLRGLWLTSVLALVLLVGLTILAVTGLLSYAAYDPLLPGNDQTPGAGLLHFYLFSWPTHPSWLYRVDQGVHITLGLALLPVVLAKLWSVLPRLFAWPPVRSLAQILERLSLIMVVGGVLFEFATGILNIQDYYVFPFSFYTAHLYGAWVFIAGLVIHVALKFPRMVRGLRSRSLRRELRTPLAGTEPEAPDPAGLRAARPGCADDLPARAAGRGRRCLAHPGRAGRRPVDRRPGPAHLAVRAARAVRDRAALPAGEPDREVRQPDGGRGGPGLPADPHREPDRLADPRATAGAAPARGGTADRMRGGLVLLVPLDRGPAGRPGPAGGPAAAGRGAGGVDPGPGSFRATTLSGAQVTDPQALLAVTINGRVLPWDHGYPARTIIPNAPGVHNTKWVNKITFMRQA